MDLKKILKKYYGYEDFREGQVPIIDSILKNKDTFAIMPTGAGKSICYQIPALVLDGLTLVISPLISLMKDQVDSLENMGIKATFINSTLTSMEVEDRLLKAKDGYYKLLYVAPERLNSIEFCNLLKSIDISLVAVDEAHCVSQWGHDFRPSYRYIRKVVELLEKKPIVAAFTATATNEVKKDIIKLLQLNEPNIFVTGFDRKNLFFSVKRGINKKDFILDYIKNNKEQVGIIYASTRKEVESLYKEIKSRGYEVGKYHGGLSNDERKKNQEEFLYDDINIMIATNAFGMGIDKSNVRYVIHNNLPANMESYYQEAGRAGRDGEYSECILLFSSQDIITQKFLMEQNQTLVVEDRGEYKKLQEIVDYCHTEKCLREYILRYFGEENVSKKCDNCSTCKDDSERVDVTLEAQKIFSCVYRMKSRFGTVLVCQVLRGSKNKRVIQFGLDKLSTYGIMKNHSEKELKDMINIFVAQGYLKLTESQYPIVGLTEKAVGVLKNKEKVYQKIERKREKIHRDNELFTLLKDARKNISTEEKIPPYIIFSDSSLREMSRVMPIDSKTMLNIKGVGESKFNKYGDIFIKLINEYIRDNNITPVKEVKKSSNVEKIPSHIITFNMYKEGKTLDEISKERDIKIVSINNHIIRCATEGLEVNLDDFIPQEQENIILEKIKEIGAEKLKPIKDELPDEITYLAIKAVICKNSF